MVVESYKTSKKVSLFVKIKEVYILFSLIKSDLSLFMSFVRLYIKELVFYGM